MAGFAEWQMEPAVAAGLEQLGWRADDPTVREVVPTVLRGGNVVAILPAGPEWAAPIVSALIGRPAEPTGAVLILAAPALIGEWATVVGAIAESTALRIEVAREALPTGTKAGSQPADVLIASPATALDRHTRSALHPDRFRAILFAWPEEWEADEAVAALLHDLPREAQRIVLTGQPGGIDETGGIVERYARKALVIAGNGSNTAATEIPRATSVRTVPTSWTGRALAAAAVLETINPAEATIWTADKRDHQLIHRTLGSLREGIRIKAQTVPESGVTVCYDVPSAQLLAELAAAGEVVLLVPPGCERYVARIAPVRRPMSLDSPAAASLDRDAVLRHEIVGAMERGGDTAAFYALAPLFERFDPQLIAAALFGLWRGLANAPRATAPAGRGDGEAMAGGSGGSPAAAASTSTAKVWIGAGKRDEATVGDFVAVLVKEVGMDRSRIGRIELRDTFALVEVPAAEADGIAQRLVGLTIRKRKLSARVDRGRDVRIRPDRGR